MAFITTLNLNVATGSRVVNRALQTTSNGQNSLSESIPDSSTDLELGFTLDVSATKSFYMVSDQDVTIETNDGTTPDDTLSLKAGVPYVWHEDFYNTFLFTTDITALFATNSSGAAAALEIVADYDPTP